VGFAASISKQVHKDTSHHLVYPPGVPLALGDIVEQHDGIWVPVGNLANDLGIALESTNDPTPADWQPTSARGYSLEVKAAGAPAAAFKYVTDAEAGVKLTLSGDRSFVFSLKDARFERIESIDNFWKEVRSKRSFWTWELRRRIVTRLVRAASGTFLASGTSEATFELSAKADLKAGVVDIADLSAGFTLKSTMSAKDRFVSAGGITPLFGAHRVKFLGGLGPAEVGAATLDQSALEEEPGDDADVAD